MLEKVHNNNFMFVFSFILELWLYCLREHGDRAEGFVSSGNDDMLICFFY